MCLFLIDEPLFWYYCVYNKPNSSALQTIRKLFMGTISKETKRNPNMFPVWKDLHEFNFKIRKVEPFMKTLIPNKED